ncbi:MAG: hypothetical protein PHT19_08905 [Methylococcus sp.]|nr:hypothetical protein [Methylococcus sp.]
MKLLGEHAVEALGILSTLRELYQRWAQAGARKGRKRAAGEVPVALEPPRRGLLGPPHHELLACYDLEAGMQHMREHVQALRQKRGLEKVSTQAAGLFAVALDQCYATIEHERVGDIASAQEALRRAKSFAGLAAGLALQDGNVGKANEQRNKPAADARHKLNHLNKEDARRWFMENRGNYPSVRQAAEDVPQYGSVDVVYRWFLEWNKALTP